MKITRLPLLGALALPVVFGFTSCQLTTVELEQIGRYQSGIFAESAAEIVSYDIATQRLFVVNANDASIDVLGMEDPANPTLQATIDATELGDGANSVDAHNGIVAVAIQAEEKTDPGLVAFYDAASLQLLKTVPAGALPDMVTFTNNGKFVLVANEGEPSDDYQIDPEGSISVIDLRHGIAAASVKTADFSAWIGQEQALRDTGVRIFGPGANAAQDLEPEYITVDQRDRFAYVSLQENNAVAKVDIRKAKVVDILPLGVKDHSLPENALDASNKDDAVNIANWPVLGMYLPDSIASYSVNGKTYLVTANEGDAREYIYETDEETCSDRGHEYDDGECIAYIDETRVEDLDLDSTVFTDEDLQDEENLGRLKVTIAQGDENGDGLYEKLYSYGARSFSIWSSEGELVFDSGSDFEVLTSARYGIDFNNTDDENDADGRSDDKGPEPEAVVIGEVAGNIYAFIGLERMGGIMVYNISNPSQAEFVQYINNRDLNVDPEEGVDAGDLAPEGFEFIAAEDSPNGKPLLAVGNEVSGTTTIYQINTLLKK